MGRRKLLLAFGASAIAGPFTCFAQQQRPKIARVGVLEATSASGSSSAKWQDALVAGLYELGYVQGKNIRIDYRRAEGKYERLPGLAAELVQMKVDVIIAATPPAIHAAQRATTSIPIIMAATADPMGQGFVVSLSRPGGNITGLSSINVEVMGKYLELLRDALPTLSRVTVLMNPTHSGHPDYLKRIQATEKANSVKVSAAQASTTTEIEAVLGTMKQERPGALIVLPDPFFLTQARRIAELATQQRLPTMFWDRDAAESGALMSYGQNLAEHYYRAASYVDKILKGAKPADLPVEQPTKFELIINVKTAKGIGVTIPQKLLLRADKVIE